MATGLSGRQSWFTGSDVAALLWTEVKMDIIMA